MKRIGPFLLIVLVASGCASPSTSVHDPVPLRDTLKVAIEPDSISTTVGEFVGFHLKVVQGKLPVSAKIVWEADTAKTSTQTTSDSAYYDFLSVGTHPVSASLFDSSANVLATAKTIVNSLPPNMSILSNYDSMSIEFSGSHVFRDTSWGAYPDCGLTVPGLSGNTFAARLRLSISDSTIGGYGHFGDSGLTVKHLNFTWFGSGSTEFAGHCTCPDGTVVLLEKMCMSNSQISLSNLPLLEVHPNSLVYGSAGVACKNHVTLTAGAGGSYTGGSYTECDRCNASHSHYYVTTVWDSSTSIRVTFFK